jgi:hypothetical protein
MALARQAIDQSRRLIREALEARLAGSLLVVAINVCRRFPRGWRIARLLGTFTSLFAAAASLPPPTVTILAPSRVTVGEPFAVAWFSSYATSCKLSGGGSGWAQTDAGASGAKNQTISAPGVVTYEVSCTGFGGAGLATETVKAEVTPSFLPAVRLDVPSSISRGKPFTLSWSSTNAKFCSLSGGGPGWAQSLAGPAGSKTQAILSATTYIVSCTGPWGTRSVRKTVEIAPTVPLPSILVYLPASVRVGQWFTVSWSATHAKSCNLSEGGPGWRQNRAATFGSKNQVLSVPGIATYTVSCVGPGGTKTVSVSVSVLGTPRGLR